MTAQIVLASASPRRRELLNQIGVQHEIYSVTIDETPYPQEQPGDYVKRIAAAKSAAVISKYPQNLPVLAADTAVVLAATIMGKPDNFVDAKMMLSRLSGKTHQVFTAVSLLGQQHQQLVSITDVSFKVLSDRDIEAYWLTGEPVDKAGAYAIQGIGAVFVKSIQGSYSGVVGLPLFETAKILTNEGIKILV